MFVSLLSIVLLVGLAVCDPLVSNYTSILIDGEEHDLVGDMVFIKDQNPYTSNSYNANTNQKWPNGVIPYYIDPRSGYTQNDINKIKGAMNEITSKTGNCIKFVPRSNQRSYITIRHTGTGCNSYVGQIYKDRDQQVSIDRPGCVHNGVVVHELIHAIGFDHEHNRPDRDYYITVKLENVEPRYRFAFNKVSFSTLNLPYDYYSVMHYDEKAFSMNGRPTMVSKFNYIDMSQVGYKSNMNNNDVKKVKALYGCR